MLVFVAAGTFFAECRARESRHVVPITVQGNVTQVTVRIGDTVVPRVLLDTGMSFDGVMIYNPAYRDSLDLSRAIEVQVGGAGSGKAPTALMTDSAAFFVGGIELTDQRIVMLQSDIYKGFPTNGVMGYSVFGHYAVEIDYDDSTMTLHDPGSLKDSLLVGEGWSPLPRSTSRATPSRGWMSRWSLRSEDPGAAVDLRRRLRPARSSSCWRGPRPSSGCRPTPKRFIWGPA